MSDDGRVVYIYSLCDPVTREPFYVGMTDNPFVRFKEHLEACAPCPVGTTRKDEMMRHLAEQNMPPMFVILQTVPEDLCPYEAEKSWTERFIRDGLPIVNFHYMNDELHAERLKKLGVNLYLYQIIQNLHKFANKEIMRVRRDALDRVRFLERLEKECASMHTYGMYATHEEIRTGEYVAENGCPIDIPAPNQGNLDRKKEVRHQRIKDDVKKTS